MTTYIERLLHKLYPKGNWGEEDPSKPSKMHPWAQMWVHLLIGITLPLICLLIVAWWPSCAFLGAFLIGLLTPLVRELHIDKHPLEDLWVPTPAGVDCRSDILSCYVGSAISCTLIGLTALLGYLT